MTDLDARVAALMPCPFCGHETPEFERMGTSSHSCIVICGNCGCSHESGDEYLQSGKSWNIRAELQKPALHEPVTDQETIDAIRACHLKVTTESMIDMRRTLESFLQGRAKPAAPSKRKEAMHLHKFEALGAEEPAQEEITDAERYRFLRMDAGIREERPFIAISSAGGISQWTGIFADKQVDAALRASKGEKT